MTFEEYINNPLESRMTAHTREMIKIEYTNRLNAVLVRENNNIEFHLYTAKDGSYYMYIKIPSETVKGFTYDVVVRFKRPSKDPHKVDTEQSLTNYDVEFFSNDPAFVYNLEYTFKSRDMFVKDLTKRGSREALTTKPKVTNPNNVVYYCKTLYWAYLIGKQRGLFTKVRYLEKYDAKRLFDMVEDSQDKIDKRQELGTSERKKKTREAKEEQPKRSSNTGSNGISFALKNPVFSIGKSVKGPSMGKVNFNKSKSVNFKK